MPRDPSILMRLSRFERKKVLGPTERALDLGFFYPPLNDPDVVKASDARFMRDDDQVLGLEFKGVARAYPVWIIDYYHAVNDTVAGEHVLAAHCDRCMSGNAFLASADGQRLLFRSYGICNATLMIQDTGSRSIWLHYEGTALEGPKAGTILEQIPVYHMTWGEWRGLHPDTGVVIPNDPRHQDPRHGHARAEWLGRAHMSREFRSTVVEEPDLRLPENTLCLFVSAGGSVRAYPLLDIKREGGVLHDVLAGREIVVLAGPKNDSFAMAAFHRQSRSTVLAFRNDGDCFRDLTTSSAWTIDGRCIEGKMNGARLQPLDFYFLRWHGWTWSHRHADLWTSESREVKGFALGEFEPLVANLASAGFNVRIGGEVVNLLRPLAVDRGISLVVDGDDMRLYRFADALTARDYEYLEGHCVRTGRFVVRSEPEVFTDNAHLTELPEDKIGWSTLLSDGRFIEAFRSAFPEESDAPAGVGLKDIYEGLVARGHRIADVPSFIEGGGQVVERFIMPSQLRVNCVSGALVSIDGDPFIVYMFKDEGSAGDYCNEEPHAFSVDRFVFRSTPEDMYTSLEVRHRPDSEIRWSTRLHDEAFSEELREITYSVTRPRG